MSLHSFDAEDLRNDADVEDADENENEIHLTLGLPTTGDQTDWDERCPQKTGIVGEMTTAVGVAAAEDFDDEVKVLDAFLRRMRKRALFPSLDFVLQLPPLPSFPTRFVETLAVIERMMKSNH